MSMEDRLHSLVLRAWNWLRLVHRLSTWWMWQILSGRNEVMWVIFSPYGKSNTMVHHNISPTLMCVFILFHFDTQDNRQYFPRTMLPSSRKFAWHVFFFALFWGLTFRCGDNRVVVSLALVTVVLSSNGKCIAWTKTNYCCVKFILNITLFIITISLSSVAVFSPICVALLFVISCFELSCVQN